MKTGLKIGFAVWLLAALMGADVSSWLMQATGLHISTSGHSHVFAHGHHFADARPWQALPNALDVLSNLPFLVLGMYGWVLLSHKALPSSPRTAARVFFTGLVFTSIFSSVYHLQPNATFGLALDRAGMAVAFAGVIGLALYERSNFPDVRPWMWGVLVLGVLSAFLPHFSQQVLPWGVVQFGGIALVLVCALRQRSTEALGVNLFAMITWYMAAKVLELNDAAVFEATQQAISGHSLKHIAASLAAVPVLAAIQRQASTTL
jgi:hypothetical protein